LLVHKYVNVQLIVNTYNAQSTHNFEYWLTD